MFGSHLQTFRTLDNDYRKHNAYLPRSSTAWRWRARLPSRRSAVLLVGACCEWILRFHGVRRLPPGLYQCREPTAGRQLCLLVEFRRYASSSKENDGLLIEVSQFRVTGARPRDHANSALCKALSGSAGRQLGLARNGRVRKKTCPAAGAERLHDVDCFLSQVADLHSGQSAASEFVTGPTRWRVGPLRFRSPISERTDFGIRSPCRRRAWQALPLASSALRPPWPRW